MTDKEVRSGEAARVQEQADSALRESEERYRTMIGNLPGFVYRCDNDHDWTMSFISDGCRGITGYAPEDFLHNKKLAFNNIIRPDYRERVWLNVQNCLQQKEAFQHEYPIVVASGETNHWVWERGRGIFSDAGQLLYIEGFITDITERKHAEEALRESEENFQHFLDDSPLGVRIVTAEGETIYANRAILDIYGFSSVEELRTTPVKSRYTPESYIEFKKRYERRQQGENSPSEYEVSVVRKNGEVRHLLVSRKRQLWNGKKQYQLIYRDITERKHAEEETQRERAFFDQLVETAPEGIAITDIHGRVMRVNAEFLRMFGYEVDEAVGQDIDDLVAPPALDAEARGISKSTGQGKTVLLETIRRRKDGTLIDVSLIGAPIVIAGKQEASYAIYRDIAERKQMEQKLEEMATHDFLTGLPNRALLLDRFTIAAALARRNKARLAVMSLDLDKFKSINDTLGHDVGDQVLKAIGIRLTRIVRASDTFARVGGDEFISVMLGTSRIEDVSVMAQKILDSFREPVSVGEHQLHLSTSIGIAIYPDDGEDLETLTKKSDAAMYYSKSHGANQFKLYEDGDVR